MTSAHHPSPDAILAASLSGDCFHQHEMWAGVLLALSLGLHRRHVPARVTVGLAALALREHALLYVAVMCAVAAWEGKRREAAAWGLGIVAFAIAGKPLGQYWGLDFAPCWLLPWSTPSPASPNFSAPPGPLPSPAPSLPKRTVEPRPLIALTLSCGR